MSYEDVTDFRTKYQKFIKWTKYMQEKMRKIEPDKFKEKWMPKFFKEVCEPLDNAWQALSVPDREVFFPKDTDIASVKARHVRTQQGDDSEEGGF